MRILLLASVMAICGAAAAGAAPAMRPPPMEPSMQVHVVRSAHDGCEPHCLQWIAAQGKIDAASPGRLKKVLSQLGDRKLPILIDSTGGSVNDALAIGRLIRAKGLDVVVARTVFTPCAAEDKACRKSKTGGELKGQAQAKSSKCASSCAFILAGGTQRFVGEGAVVGVHQITMILRRYMILTRHSFGVPVETRKTLVSEQTAGQKNEHTRNTYGNIKRYLADMGIDDAIMPLILSTPGHRVHWLTPDELRATRLATHRINGEQLMTGTITSPPPGTVVPHPMVYHGICGTLEEGTAGCAKADVPSEPQPGLPAEVMRLSPAQSSQ
ncbi:MAG: hypothetical protein K2X43_02600 [Hyphomonadaceae bacterium]|jgi:hypothetical protein|nr:hypothetical protein [Hyphomonadaceae bacterium]